MKQLSISPNLSLPVEVGTQTSAILGIRGSGKTHTAKVIAEELLTHGHQIVVIDPLDAWWGLKSSADGKAAGYPVVVLGGQHGDLPVKATDGQTVADFIVENPVSCVLSLRHLSKADQRRFVTDFCERVYFRKGEPGRQGPLPIFIDEASSFVPQRVTGDVARMVGAIEDFVRRGRQSGLGVFLIDQRAASVNKDVLTQIEMLVCHRTTSPQDRAALREWIKAHDTEGNEGTFMESLASLGKGDAWVWSPAWLGVFERTHIRALRTFDSSATPKAGAKQTTPAKLADVNLAALREQLSATVEEARANDPRELRKRITDLERELSEARKKEVQVETERVEVPVITQEQLEMFREIGGIVTKHMDTLSIALNTFEKAIALCVPAGHSKPVVPWSRHSVDLAQPVSRERAKRVMQLLEPVGEAATHTSRPAVHNRESPQIKAGARRMLEVVAAHHRLKVTKAQLATLAQMKVTGGTFSTYYNMLKREGLISEQEGKIQITPAGMGYLGVGAPPEPRTTEELLAQWRPALKRGAVEMLDYLVAKYPHAVMKSELAKAVNMEVTGGTFGTYLGTLKRNGLIEVEDGEVRASETLFLF